MGLLVTTPPPSSIPSITRASCPPVPSLEPSAGALEIAEFTFRPQASSSELRTPMTAGALGIGMSVLLIATAGELASGDAGRRRATVLAGSAAASKHTIVRATLLVAGRRDVAAIDLGKAVAATGQCCFVAAGAPSQGSRFA
jgi:hypothetical protein